MVKVVGREERLVEKNGWSSERLAQTVLQFLNILRMKLSLRLIVVVVSWKLMALLNAQNVVIM